MKNFNFAIAVVFSLCLAFLGDMNVGDPMKGWVLGVLIVSLSTAVGIGIGLIKSRFVEEEGAAISFMVGILYLSVVISPILIIKGWQAVAVSFGLLVLWNLIYNSYNRE